MADVKKYVSLDKLTKYDAKIKSVISTGDAAALQSAKDYADSLATNYDASGSAASALVDAKAYADGKDTAIAEAKQAGVDAAAAAATADGKAVAAQTHSEGVAADLAKLDAYVGDIPSGYTETNVIAYVNKKAEETLNAASGGSSESAASVLAALNSYKAENDPKVTKNTEDIATAQAAADAAQAHSEGVASDLAEAIEALEDADAGQVERIAALEGTIVGLSGAMHFEGVKDAVPEDVSGYEQGDVIIVGNKEYVLNGDAFVEFGDVSAQAEAITELTGRLDTAEGEIDQLQTDLDTAEEAIAAKAEKTYVDEQVQALQGVDSTQNEKIAALEAKFGGAEGSVEDMIADAKAEAISEAGAAADTKDEAVLAAAKKYADDEDAEIEATISTLQGVVDGKAAASDVTTLQGKVSTLEGDMAQAKTDIDAVEVLAAANDAAIKALQTASATHALQSDLETLAGRVTTNEQNIAAFVEVSEEEINGLFTA